jgi:NADP-dependent 3-hydroxy acid dehydrogenase YdfG
VTRSVSSSAADGLDLTDKVVIVTGASSGIGAATAELLHAAGAHPVLAARRADRLAELGGRLGGALSVPTDVTEAAGRQELIAATLGRWGRIDALVNNAGVGIRGPLDALDLTEFRYLLDVNVTAVVALMQAVLEPMRRTGGGRIVNISSGTTRGSMPGLGAYAATKSALNMVTAVARKEFAADGVAVCLVVPSITTTEFQNSRYLGGVNPDTGAPAHSPAYVGRSILRAVRTGEERIEIPNGPEQTDIE